MDKLLKLKNQILWIKQSNIGNSKFDSLTLPINNNDFHQRDNRKNYFTREKKFHKEEKKNT